MGEQWARLAEELIQCGFKSWLEGAHSQWIGVGPSPHPDPHKICIEHPITEKILLSECCSQEWMHLELGASCCLDWPPVAPPADRPGGRDAHASCIWAGGGGTMKEEKWKKEEIDTWEEESRVRKRRRRIDLRKEEEVLLPWIVRIAPGHSNLHLQYYPSQWEVRCSQAA